MDRTTQHTMNRMFPALQAGVTLALLLAASGCGVLANAIYFVKGNNVTAECNLLEGKKIAVVVRPVTTLEYRNSGVARDLAKQIGVLLEKNGHKVQVVSQREIAQWADENDWEEYNVLGKNVGADLVVGLDLEEFSLYQGQTLYQGKANVSIGVYDAKGGKEPIWEKSLPQMLYPPTGGIAASEKPEHQFRRQFLMTIAEQVARHFYEHDPTTDFASDSTALN